jgi:hypothetical protein
MYKYLPGYRLGHSADGQYRHSPYQLNTRHMQMNAVIHRDPSNNCTRIVCTIACHNFNVPHFQKRAWQMHAIQNPSHTITYSNPPCSSLQSHTNVSKLPKHTRRSISYFFTERGCVFVLIINDINTSLYRLIIPRIWHRHGDGRAGDGGEAEAAAPLGRLELQRHAPLLKLKGGGGTTLRLILERERKDGRLASGR